MTASLTMSSRTQFHGLLFDSDSEAIKTFARTFSNHVNQPHVQPFHCWIDTTFKASWAPISRRSLLKSDFSSISGNFLFKTTAATTITWFLSQTVDLSEVKWKSRHRHCLHLNLRRLLQRKAYWTISLLDANYCRVNCYSQLAASTHTPSTINWFATQSSSVTFRVLRWHADVIQVCLGFYDVAIRINLSALIKSYSTGVDD